MGRASSMASPPPWGKERGSALPIENSPPGIQTIPSGTDFGGGMVFARVGRNTYRSAESVVAECNRTGSRHAVLDTATAASRSAKDQGTVFPHEALPEQVWRVHLELMAEEPYCN